MIILLTKLLIASDPAAPGSQTVTASSGATSLSVTGANDLSFSCYLVTSLQ